MCMKIHGHKINVHVVMYPWTVHKHVQFNAKITPLVHYHMYINFMTMNFHTHEHIRKSAISTPDSGLKQKFTSIF